MEDFLQKIFSGKNSIIVEISFAFSEKNVL